jgi:hypothetical protein
MCKTRYTKLFQGHAESPKQNKGKVLDLLTSHYLVVLILQRCVVSEPHGSGISNQFSVLLLWEIKLGKLLSWENKPWSWEDEEHLVQSKSDTTWLFFEKYDCWLRWHNWAFCVIRESCFPATTNLLPDSEAGIWKGWLEAGRYLWLCKGVCLGKTFWLL